MVNKTSVPVPAPKPSGTSNPALSSNPLINAPATKPKPQDSSSSSSNPALSTSVTTAAPNAAVPVPAPLKPKTFETTTTPLKQAPAAGSKPVVQSTTNQREDREKSIEKLDQKKIVSSTISTAAATPAVATDSTRPRSNSKGNDNDAIFTQAVEWLKSYGCTVGVTKSTLFDTINDGVNLIKCLEKATNSAAPKYHAKAFMPAHRIDNFNVALAMISKAGISINVAAQELHDKDSKKTAVLFTALIAKFPLSQ